MSQLTARKANTAAPYPPWWTVSEVYVHNGRTLDRASWLTIRGVRGGVFRFWDHVIAPPRPGSGKRKTAEWITVVGGPRGISEFRSFRPDRISRVMTTPPRPRRKQARKKAAQA